MSIKRRTRSFWRRLVAEVDRGATVVSTAQRHGVRPKTLSWWRWMLRREEKSVTSTRLLPVVLSGEVPCALEPRPEPIAVMVRDDVALRVPIGSDVSYVAALVAAVRKTC